MLCLLAYDEAAQLHERLNGVAEMFVTPEGALSLPWVVLAGVFAAGFGLAYLRFLLSLPRRIAGMMLSAGAIYVGGALVVEMIGASYVFEHDAKYTVRYELIATAEETFEMIGMALFGYAMLRLLDEDGAEVVIAAERR